jgi:ribosomal protein S18 acetylase RimI-like enzyme
MPIYSMRNVIMNKLDIKNVGLEELDDFIGLCIPEGKESNFLFLAGASFKREWAEYHIKKYGSIGKIAYYNDKPVGMIQAIPIPEQNIYEITCIFIPSEDHLQKGIGRKLFMELLEDLKKPKAFMDNKAPEGLIVWPFDIPGRYPQSAFFKKMGFREVSEETPYILYYPLKEGFEYKIEEIKYTPSKRDCNRAVIYYDPNCPFCIYFTAKTYQAINELGEDINIDIVNKFWASKRDRSKKNAPFCVVNGYPINTFISDKEGFKREVSEAFQKECGVGEAE